MSEAVEELIIKPMLAIYPPPQHLRGDCGRQAEALAAYRKALAPFDRATLATGWEHVTAEHPFWVWPNPGAIAEACRRCAPPPPAVSETERARQRAVEMTDAYAARFMKTTQQATLAHAEGWAPQLAEYVREAAWVQAQLICGVRPVGFATILIPADQRGRPAGEAFAAYRESIAGPVERGRIRVTVPPEQVRAWRLVRKESDRATDRHRGRG